MTDDVISFGVMYYLARYVLIGLFFLVMTIIMYPWIIGIALLLWLWYASSNAPVPALRVDSEPEGTARWHFLQEQERQKLLAAQAAPEAREG